MILRASQKVVSSKSKMVDEFFVSHVKWEDLTSEFELIWKTHMIKSFNSHLS